MGDVIDLRAHPTGLEGNHEFVSDLARFRENLLDEKAIRKKYRLADETWEKLADDDELIRKVEEELVRRIRNGSSKKEKAQALIVKGPEILDSIMSGGNDVSPRHKIDAIRTLDGMTSTGGEAATTGTYFEITINLGEGHTTHYRKPIDISPSNTDHFNDVDDDTSSIATPWGLVEAISTKKDDGGGQEHI